MRHTFEECIDIVLQWEGSYVNHPDDPGGETKFGIAKKFYPHLNIAALTKADALAIYSRDYWDHYNMESIPAFIRLQVFDMTVNMGYKNAIRVLQRALNLCGKNIQADGAFGPETATALLGMDKNDTAKVFPYMLGIERLNYYVSLSVSSPKLLTFLKGWTRRANEVMLESIR